MPHNITEPCRTVKLQVPRRQSKFNILQSRTSSTYPKPQEWVRLRTELTVLSPMAMQLRKAVQGCATVQGYAKHKNKTILKCKERETHANQKGKIAKKYVNMKIKEICNKYHLQ